MKTRSIFKKLAALAVVLALVLSLGGVALAAPTTVTVHFNANGGSPTPASIEVPVTGSGVSARITFSLPTEADCSRPGYALLCWNYRSLLGEPGDTMTIFLLNDCSARTVTAQWIAVEDHYILKYDITPPVDGQPDDPPDEHATSPIIPSAVVTMPGYNFVGWTTPEYTLMSKDYQGRGDERRLVRFFEGTTTGFFTQMAVHERATYTLYHQNKQPGVVFWPDDVVNSETKPVIMAGDPVLPGYRFIGWEPSTLMWDKARVTVTSEVVTPGPGDPYEETLPYVLITTNRQLTITAVFEGIPTPEIPIEAPQTGDVNYLGYAMLLLGLSASLAGFVLVRSRRKN